MHAYKYYDAAVLMRTICQLYIHKVRTEGLYRISQALRHALLLLFLLPSYELSQKVGPLPFRLPTCQPLPNRISPARFHSLPTLLEQIALPSPQYPPIFCEVLPLWRDNPTAMPVRPARVIVLIHTPVLQVPHQPILI